MRLTCPNCAAQYEVDDAAIPAEGRDVQCSACGHAWYQHRAVAATPDPEPAPEPVPEAQSEADPDLQPAPQPDDQPVQRTPAQALDPAMADVLREEAEREAKARRGELADPIEEQTEFALSEPDEPETPPDPETQQDLDSARALVAAARDGKSRKDLLPDIEEINSSLRAKGDRATGPARPMTPEEQIARMRRGQGFRLGMSLMLLITAGLLFTYIFAPEIQGRAPGLTAQLESYVGTVDVFRLKLDDALQGLSANLSSFLES